LKIPKYILHKYNVGAKLSPLRETSCAQEPWRMKFPQIAKAFDELTALSSAGRFRLEDLKRIAKKYPQLRGEGRGHNSDALARSPTGAGRFVDGGAGDWSDHQNATSSDPDDYSYNPDLDDPTYDPEPEAAAGNTSAIQRPSDLLRGHEDNLELDEEW
jgi:hypothetical protein